MDSVPCPLPLVVKWPFGGRRLSSVVCTSQRYPTELDQRLFPSRIRMGPLGHPARFMLNQIRVIVRMKSEIWDCIKILGYYVCKLRSPLSLLCLNPDRMLAMKLQNSGNDWWSPWMLQCISFPPGYPILTCICQGNSILVFFVDPSVSLTQKSNSLASFHVIPSPSPDRTPRRSLTMHGDS